MTRFRYGIALSAACAAMLLTGCGSGEGLQSSDVGEPASAPVFAARENTDGGTVGDNPVADQAGPARPTPSPKRRPADGVISDVKLTQEQQRQVIYTGSMTVRAKQVSTSALQAKQIVTEAGGYLAQEESNSASDTEDSARLEFKIPPAKYAEVLGRLGKDLGTQLSMKQGTEDVTLKVADVESRLKSAQQSLDSLRTLMKKADTIGQVLQVEREISARESDLESLQAQQKELTTQVAMATLTLRLVGPVAVVEDPDEEPAGFFGGLEAGWRAMVAFTKTALTVIGALLPWLAVSLPLVALLVYLVRRDRRRRPAGPTRPGAEAA
ncbi:DUF4349 domain-containing protein [Nonomuraea insulae]|uniref:DUF4349 domain-containing protein n=1 Tax=Nonomuraea insulae TaxID=1616787 RepID=A0ABW1CXD0_9ACTN